MTAVELPQGASGEPQKWPLSVRAYHALGEMGLIPEKTELLYGEVYCKMPKSPLHTLLLMRLLQWLQSVVPIGTHIRSEQPIVCGDSEPEPDLCVIKGSIDDYASEHPRTAEMVIEICVTSHDFDRLKLPAYANAGVKEVWLILAPEQQIELHHEPRSGQFSSRSVHGPWGQLASQIIPQFKVDLGKLFKK
jgi:Uma2 family endonuclease